MTPYYYEIFTENDLKTPEYKGIVIAANEDIAYHKVEQWYYMSHDASYPTRTTIHETIT